MGYLANLILCNDQNHAYIQPGKMLHEIRKTQTLVTEFDLGQNTILAELTFGMKTRQSVSVVAKKINIDMIA